MVKISGTSKIDVNMAAFGETLESCIPEGTGELEVKLDARGNVRSTFMQTDGKVPGKATIYTGAVEALWDTTFKSTDGPKDALQAMLFIGGMVALKFQTKKKYSMKVDTMNNIRVEDDFESVKGVLENMCNNYNSAAAASPEEPAKVKTSTKATSSKKTSKSAPQPVTNVPEVEIPKDLDLVGEAEVKAAVSPIKVQSSAELEAEVEAKVGEALGEASQVADTQEVAQDMETNEGNDGSDEQEALAEGVANAGAEAETGLEDAAEEVQPEGGEELDLDAPLI